MTDAIIQFAIAALMIIGAGAWLTHCADCIAEKTGLGRVLVGSLFLAAATSLPEIMVDFNAIAINQPDLAVGNLLGSSFFNLLNLMVVSTIFLLPERALIRAEQSHAIAAVWGVMLTAMIGLGLISSLDIAFLRAGIFPWLAFLGYLFGLYVMFEKTRPVKRDETRPPAPGRLSLAQAIVGYIAGAMVILLAAPYLADAADRIAAISGLGHSFVGTTLLALSTTLPELVVIVTAFRMGCPDLALGNIFGSNLFNMAIFLPLDWYYENNLLAGAEDINAVTAMGVIFATSIAAVTLLHMPSRKSTMLVGNGFVAGSILMILWLLYHVKHAV